MLFVRLNDAYAQSVRALFGLSLMTSIAACGADDVQPKAITDKSPTSAQLPSDQGTSDDSPGSTPGAPNAGTGGSNGNPNDGSNDDPAAPGDPSTPGDPGTPARPLDLRGTNLVGMEGGYSFSQSDGPVADKDYAVHSNQIVDYLASKKVSTLRFLFSWERMQSKLGGPVPAASSGNYKGYFDNYKRIVDYATSKGMNVVVEPWQSGGSGAGGARYRGTLVGSDGVTSAHFADFWAKMAAVYKDNPRVSIGLVNEPNSMSTMTWWGIAQDAVTAIRNAGFTGEIFVPGNGWTAAGSWTSGSYDTDSAKRSNAYGWANAGGAGKPFVDPLGKSIVEVHTYADPDASGSSTDISSTTVSRSRVKNVTDWAKANGVKVWIGEIGMYADAKNAAANWNDFVSYVGENEDTIVGWAWWACGKPGWWNDIAANGGGHFAITPTNDYKTDTVNMKMIEAALN